MRTWKWMFTAALLVSVSAAAQQPAESQPSDAASRCRSHAGGDNAGAVADGSPTGSAAAGSAPGRSRLTLQSQASVHGSGPNAVGSASAHHHGPGSGSLH